MFMVSSGLQRIPTDGVGYGHYRHLRSKRTT